MSFSHSAIRIPVLLFILFCGEAIIAQEKTTHPCFEQPNGARDAIDRLPESPRAWLVEDAAYIIKPEERCAFLHLKTDQQREQFIEQFWYRRTVEGYDVKAEHYRRIVFANEKYGGQVAGWKTNRGRIYVLFGPPDSVDLAADHSRPASAPHPGADTYLQAVETWHYAHIQGIGESVDLHFELIAGRVDYALAPQDQFLLEQSNLYPDSLRMPRFPKIRFKDLEALVTARIVRDQVKFTHRIDFAAATHATTLARIDVQIPCEACTRDGQVVPSVVYPLFVRVSKPSGWGCSHFGDKCGYSCGR